MEQRARRKKHASAKQEGPENEGDQKENQHSQKTKPKKPTQRTVPEVRMTMQRE